MRWLKDERSESVLGKLEIGYEYRTINKELVDIKESRVNRARPVAICDETAEDYAKAMVDGDRFPAVVLAKVEGREPQFLIAGGNHRLMAACEINGETDFYAIVTDHIDNIQFDILAKALNSVEGRRESRSVRIDQAADLVMKYGVSSTEASKQMCVSSAAVSARVRSELARDEAVSLGIVLNVKVPRAALDAISRFRDDNETFGPLAKMIKEGNTAKTMEEVCRELDKADTREQRRTMIPELKKTMAPTKKRSFQRTQYTELCSALSRIERLTKKAKSYHQLQVTEENIKEVQSRWREITKKMRSILTSGSET